MSIPRKCASRSSPAARRHPTLRPTARRKSQATAWLPTQGTKPLPSSALIGEMPDEAGGAAELQTDVMRFMAIISMCLVAIFALVQSIPLAPQSPATDVEVQPEPVKATEPMIETTQPMAAEAQIVTLTRPEPVVMRSSESPVALQRPARTVKLPVESPKPAVESTAAEPRPQTQVVATTPEHQGFTLRFESDAVLTRLVENGTIGLYVIAGNQARRLQIESGRISYWSSSTPDQIHEMDPATVPNPFITTWNRQHGEAGSVEKWGVSLPPSMSRQVRTHIAGSDGGSLIIGDSGQVRLER